MGSEKAAYFLNLRIETFRCFGDVQRLDLSDSKGSWRKWTLILGDNGTGKTSLLKVLAAFEIETGFKSNEFSPRGFRERIQFSGIERIGHSQTEVGIYDIKGSLFKHELEIFLDGSEVTVYRIESEPDLSNLKCYGYGANRFISFNTLSESKTENSETLFDDDAKLINAEEWLLQLDYAASKESEVQQLAEKKREQVKDILLDLLPDIYEIRFTTPTKESLKSTVEFLTPYGWVTIHQLSLGYKTMVAWVVDLAARMFERYPDSENPLAEPAIVLVDEIDLHLHPKWQRKIFDYLDERFPKTQFIVTAHSPLVVQSAPKDANIVLLKREGDHVVIDQNIESVRTWRLDQIMSSDLFGESGRNPEVEKQLNERTVLLQKSKLTPEETARLQELNKLAHRLPTAERKEDIEAMEIIRKAGEIVKNK